MNLLFIFTGGTIGSTVSGGYISTDENVPYELLNVYRKRYDLRYSYDIITPYTELSEQNTGSTISKLIDCVRDAISNNVLIDAPDNDNKNNRCIYDGVIITHGTDTLPYSAAALSYALGNVCIPVCLVSSNYPITDERSNGVDNLHGAIRLIEAFCAQNGAGIGPSGSSMGEDSGENGAGIGPSSSSMGEDSGENGAGISPSGSKVWEGHFKSGVAQSGGVFVPYKNHDGIIYIHRAARLLETRAFSDEYFSVKDQYYGTITGDVFQKNENYVEQEDRQEPLGFVELKDVCREIARYHLFPGIAFNDFEEGNDRKNVLPKCILLEGYHSGTMNTKFSGYQKFFEEMYEKGVSLYLVGVRHGVSYKSTALYDKLHIKPIYDIAPVAAYMKLWMLMASGREWSADILSLPLGGDL